MVSVVAEKRGVGPLGSKTTMTLGSLKSQKLGRILQLMSVGPRLGDGAEFGFQLLRLSYWDVTSANGPLIYSFFFFLRLGIGFNVKYLMYLFCHKFTFKQKVFWPCPMAWDLSALSRG